MGGPIELSTARILVTGSGGFLGGHVVAELRRVGATFLTLPEKPETDLLDASSCREVVEGVDLVLHLAATVGGVGFLARHPARTLYENVLMNTQLMEAARLAGVAGFVSVGTTCAYPAAAAVPLREDDLWNGFPSRDTAAYGIAKRLLLLQGQCYREQYGFRAVHLLPVNLYGPGASFDVDGSNVIPALVRRFVEATRAAAERVTVWGTGSATRDFLYVEDAARAIVHAARVYDGADPVNLGSGIETSIRQLVETVVHETGYRGEVAWDPSKPEGARRMVVDCTRAEAALGRVARTDLRTGIRRTVEDFVRRFPRRDDS